MTKIRICIHRGIHVAIYKSMIQLFSNSSYTSCQTSEFIHTSIQKIIFNTTEPYLVEKEMSDLINWTNRNINQENFLNVLLSTNNVENLYKKSLGYSNKVS